MEDIGNLWKLMNAKESMWAHVKNADRTSWRLCKARENLMQLVDNRGVSLKRVVTSDSTRKLMEKRGSAR